ncbi:MAG: WD40/YVTN/BNR-like repeat-containing protein, partial [Candidatus Binatia bacterium]
LDSVWNIPWVSTITYPVAAVEPHVRDITIDPKDPKTMYVALQVGYMLKTTDGGKNWELLNKNLDCDVHTIVLHPDNANQIYIATGGHDCRAGKAPGRALYSSSDGGKSWSPMAMEFKEEYSVPLAVHPTKHNVIYSAVANGQPGAWRKRNGDAQAYLIQSTDAARRGRNWTARCRRQARASLRASPSTRRILIACTRHSATATCSAAPIAAIVGLNCSTCPSFPT